MEVDTIELLRKKLTQQDGWQQIGSLTIHFTDACNLRCCYCSYAEQHRSSMIQMETLAEALSHNPIYSCIVGGGEPTLVRSREVDFISLLEQFPFTQSVYMITNGTVMPGGFEKVADRFDFIRLSLDAATPETYRLLKGVDRFNQVLSNIRLYLKTDIRQVGVSFIIQKANLREVPDVIRLLAPIYFEFPGRFFLKFKNLRAATESLTSQKEVDRVYLEVKELRESSALLESFLDLATNSVEIPQLSEGIDSKPPLSERCYYALLYCLVRTNGDIYPCGLMSRKEQHCLGNIRRVSWDVICDRQWTFFEQAGKGCLDCVGCWDEKKNRVLEEILTMGLQPPPSLTRLGAINGLYCRW